MNKKTYEKLKNGDLKVIIETEAKLEIPHEEDKVEIGTFKQTTTQIIKKDKIHVLKCFIKNQKEAAEGQLHNLKEEQERLKDINENLIPDNILKKILEFGGSNKSKSIVKYLKNLDLYLKQSTKKKQLKQQIDFIGPQLKEMIDDEKELLSL